MIRFQFVDDYATTYSVKRLCHVLNLNRSSFYKWRDGKPARRQRQHADEVLVAQMRDYHEEFDATIGVRRMTAEINDTAPTPVNHKRIERLMRQHQIAGVNLRKKKRTTIPDQDARVFDDLVGRDFTAEDCNQLYIGDITYLPCGKGEFMYLATVIDVCSRRLVGYSLADHMRTTCVPVSSRTRLRTRHAREAPWTGQYFTRTTAASIPAQRSRPRAGGWGSASRWAGSDRVRITRWLSRSTPR